MKNLIEDILASEQITFKVKDSIYYTQSLYAALCNNTYETTDKSTTGWSCSWRRAARLVADIREEGDYIDWYCSGMTGSPGFVHESFVTSEISEDFLSIGWQCLSEDLNIKE